MSQATTYSVSPHLLAREDFRAACAARDFGTVFRMMKKYDGASQDRICSPVEGLAQYVAQARLWFDSVWATVAKDYPHS